jgi:hypothetical protein
MKRFAIVLLFAALAFAPLSLFAQQPDDAEYTKQIRQFTTGPNFATELVDHLPASDKVPSPLKFNGYIAGADGHLTYAEDVYKYMRALEAASPRVRVFSIGKTEEGREMILVAISSDATMAKLDHYRDITKRLADPRSLSDADARKLIDEGKPMYYLTGTIHSPETGSPEMLMELAYRLAVDESPRFKEIRDNVIVLMTPVIEVDGHNRQVDLWHYKQANPKLPTPPLVYWGHYVAHDNNRDNLGATLALSRNVLHAYFEFHPTVMHDLHESVPFMYVMMGTGPYNPSLDPLMINEWTRMAFQNVDELTRRGLAGVWTYGFYDGWAPNYMLWVGTGHNTIGRFYETFGNRWPTTEDRVVRGQSTREWYRPNPPLPTVKWSLRDNVNYQQSGVLFSLSDMAQNRHHFLENFYTLSKRSVAKAANEGPAAWVFDGAQKRQGQLHDLLSTLKLHGVEVQVADESFTLKPDWPPATAASGGRRAAGGGSKETAAKETAVKDATITPDDQSDKPAEEKKAEEKSGDERKPDDKKPAEKKKDESVTFAKGSYIIRMDQPYSRLADAMLDVQYVRGTEQVYDDTGWTLGYLKNVDFKRIANPDVLKVPMHPWSAEPAASPRIVANHADTDYTHLAFAAKSARISDEETTVDGKKYPAGSLVLDGALSVKAHDWKSPRIAVMHSWTRTQDEGWWRIGLEQLGVPYTYISTQDVTKTPNLRDRFDVIIFPPVGGQPQDTVNGLPPGPPLPWKKTALTPNLGVDQTDDIRPGLSLAGVDRLAKFVEDGGLLVTSRDTSVLAVQYGLARYVRVAESSPKFRAPGTIVAATVVDRKSPIAAGYDETLPLVFAGSPFFRVGIQTGGGEGGPGGGEGERVSGRGGKNDPDVPQGRPFVPTPERPKPAPGEEGFQLPEDMPGNVDYAWPKPEDRPRVIVSFSKDASKLLMSGMLEGAEELAGKPAVIDAPRGKGHILLMASNPFWRGNTEGMYALVMNAVMNWDRLGGK